MTKRLLNKTTANLVLFSTAILLIAAPVFYFLSHRLYLEETDETLKLHQEEFVEYYLPKFHKNDIALWNKYNRNIKILPFNGDNDTRMFTKTYYDKLEDEHEPYREINKPITIDGQQYTYQDRINMIETEDMAINVALLFMGVIAILLIGMLIINKISAQRLWRPFYDTLEKIGAFEIDKHPPHFLATDIEEFTRLNSNLDRLVAKNISIYKNQREFIENAAHELQTPLALFQAHIDSLYQMDNSQGQSRLLSQLNDDVARLNRLNKNLLLLSKIEGGQYFEKQTIVLNEAVKKHLDFFTEQARAKGIEILTEFSETVKVESNISLVEIMVNNLFLNAIRHNVENGKIVITLTHDSLTFSNTGSEGALDSQKVFRRFAKLNPSGHGNGLGLAIIKKVVDLNDWQIDYTFRNTLHGFRVKFQ